MTITINTNNVIQTLEIAERIGSRLQGGEVIELISDLGGGKTTFTKGLAAGAKSEDKVHSPSFTIENEYRAEHLTIHHLDFYRLIDPGIMKNELIETLEDSKNVIVIEWADIVENVLPETRLIIKIKSLSETERQFEIDYPESLSYLVDGLK
jgi:tRNA threonylcarbamoyladenosine biosynthesis protein TsaE